MKRRYYITRVLLTIPLVGFLSGVSYTHIVVDSTKSKAIVSAHNLGPNVNSATEDLAPYLLGNGLTLYFSTRRTTPTSRLDHIWFVKRKSRDPAWGEPVYLKALNNDYAFGGLTMDDSGKIYFATNNKTTENNDMNIWEGVVENKTLNIKPLPSPVNTLRWESQPSMTGKGENLYFSSNRGHPADVIHGQVDIFVTHKNLNGSWTEPTNIGAHVNIGHYNATPFISPDNTFLFFTSDGKSNSKKNIYLSTRTGPKDDDWSEAVLLPSAINSEADNLFPMIANDGKTIYFSSNRSGGYGGFDIYEATLPEDIQNKIFHSFPGY